MNDPEVLGYYQRLLIMSLQPERGYRLSNIVPSKITVLETLSSKLNLCIKSYDSISKTLEFKRCDVNLAQPPLKDRLANANEKAQNSSQLPTQSASSSGPEVADPSNGDGEQRLEPDTNSILPWDTFFGDALWPASDIDLDSPQEDLPKLLAPEHRIVMRQNKINFPQGAIKGTLSNEFGSQTLKEATAVDPIPYPFSDDGSFSKIGNGPTALAEDVGCWRCQVLGLRARLIHFHDI